MSSTKREMTVNEAVQAMVHEGPVSADQLAEDVFDGKSPSMVYKMIRADEPSADVPLRKFVPLVKRVNQGRKDPDYRPAEAMCRELGGVFVLLPNGRIISGADLLAQAGNILTETGEATGRIGKALQPDSPGGTEITPGEALDARVEIWEAIQELALAWILLDPERLAQERAQKARLKLAKCS